MFKLSGKIKTLCFKCRKSPKIYEKKNAYFVSNVSSWKENMKSTQSSVSLSLFWNFAQLLGINVPMDNRKKQGTFSKENLHII